MPKASKLLSFADLFDGRPFRVVKSPDPNAPECPTIDDPDRVDTLISPEIEAPPDEPFTLNPLFVRAVAGEDKRPRAMFAALRIMSATRGADSEDLDFKQWLVTPIRMWICGARVYADAGYTTKVKPLAFTTREQWLDAIKSADNLARAARSYPWQSPNDHFIGHACVAIGAIAYLEGWTDREFKKWFHD